MHAYGRTLRRVGDLRLLGLPVGSGRERYGVADGFEPVATYPTLERALAAFEAVRQAIDAEAHGQQLTAGGSTAAAATKPRVRGGRGGMAVTAALVVAVLGLGALIGEALYL